MPLVGDDDGAWLPLDLRILLRPPRCANCGREPREDEKPGDEWRVYSDGVGELVIFCPECWEREFGTSGNAE